MDLERDGSINKSSLSDQIFSVLLGRITNLVLKPGQRINLGKLKDEFGVSNAPIREALYRLSQEKLILVKPRIGYFVVEITFDEVRELFAARNTLETYALREAMGAIPREALAGLRSRTIELKGDKALPGRQNLLDGIDVELHKELIVRSCGNRFIMGFYESISYFGAIIRHLNLRGDSDIAEHLAMIDSILEGDLEQAESALILHLRNAEEMTLSGFRL
jgi:DNA-binding GntR family transcriptional regulator